MNRARSKYGGVKREVARLHRQHPHMTCREIVDITGYLTGSVRRAASRLGIKFPFGPMNDKRCAPEPDRRSRLVRANMTEKQYVWLSERQARNGDSLSRNVADLIAAEMEWGG